VKRDAASWRSVNLSTGTWIEILRMAVSISASLMQRRTSVMALTTTVMESWRRMLIYTEIR